MQIIKKKLEDGLHNKQILNLYILDIFFKITLIKMKKKKKKKKKKKIKTGLIGKYLLFNITLSFEKASSSISAVTNLCLHAGQTPLKEKFIYIHIVYHNSYTHKYIHTCIYPV